MAAREADDKRTAKRENDAISPSDARRHPHTKDDQEVYEAGITEDEISPHPGIGGILADPKGETDRRGG